MGRAKELARLLLSFRGTISRAQFLAVMVILAGAVLLVGMLDRKSGLIALAVGFYAYGLTQRCQ